MTVAGWFRGVLALAPTEFRHTYGAAMTADFCQIFAEESAARGPVAAWRYACAALADALATSLRERAAIVARDVAFASRSLARTPLFTGVVVLTFALGIGANAAVFSVVDGVLVHPLPYTDPGRLVMIWRRNAASSIGDDVMSLEDSLDAGRMAEGIEQIGALASSSGVMNRRGAPPYRFSGTAMTPGLLRTLGVRPQLGRVLSDEDARPSAARAALISDRYWRTRFAADPHVVGTRVLVNDRATTIVGVLPPDFLPPSPYRFGNGGGDVVLALRPAPAQRSQHYLNTVARVKPGVGIETLQHQLDLVSARLAAAYPASNRAVTLVARPLSDSLIGGTKGVLAIVAAAVLALLLVACANVANLLLARSTQREHELAVRLAVGADRSRIVAQLLTESLVLAAAGAAAGVALAALAVRAFVAAAPGELPRLDRVAVDPLVVAVTACTTIAAAILAGLAPALTLSRPDIAAVLALGDRGRSGGRTGARNAFVVIEIAVALVLVATSALALRSFEAATTVDTGFASAQLTSFESSSLTAVRYPSAASRARFYDRLTAQLGAIPGVQAAALAITVPFANDNSDGESFWIAGRPRPLAGREDETGLNAVTPGYFDTLQLRTRRGRLFSAHDRLGAVPVAVVDEGFVRRYFGGEEPVGKRVSIDMPIPVWRTIVGVVPSIHSVSMLQPDSAMLYLPLAQAGAFKTNDGLLRSVAGAAPTTAQLAAAYRAVDPLLAPPRVRAYSAVIAAQTARARTTAALLAALAAVALVLALAGIYSVISYDVVQRTREFGIRMALGARTTSILTDVVVRGMRLTVLGVCIGLAGAAAAARILAAQLYGVDPFEPENYAGVVALVFACALVALLVPAWRATRVDPMIALRHE